MSTLKQWNSFFSIIVIISSSIIGLFIIFDFHLTNSSQILTLLFPSLSLLGGFISIGITICTYECIFSIAKVKFYLYLCIILILTFALFNIGSRAAIIAPITSILFILFFRRHISHSKSLFFITIILFIGFVLYFFRPDSVDGRILVWRVSLDMISERPILGFGLGGFNSSYLYYQANYLETHPECHYAHLASNVVYPYNTILHIAVNFGLPVAILTCGFIIYLIFKKSDECNTNFLTRAILLNITIFSCFSFPVESPILCVIFFICLCSLHPFGLKRFHRICTICIIFIGATISAYTIYSTFLFYNAEKLFSKYNYKREEGLRYMGCGAKCLKFSPKASELYARYALKNFDGEKRKEVIEFVLKISPSAQLICTYGDILWAEGRMQEAEKAYKLSSNMIPSLIEPKYKLMKLFADCGKHNLAEEQAIKIVITPLKIRNTKAIRMINSAKDYLYDRNSFNK